MVRVPLADLPNSQWVVLRRLAYCCAQFGNHLLSESYLKAKGGPRLPTYKDAKGELSAAIRDAVGRECVGIWRRLGRRILRGEQTLARFSANRALVIRDRGVRLETEESGTYVVRLRLLPQEAGEATSLPVFMPALRKDAWLAARLATLATGECPITKATVVFKRPGRKVFVLLTYAALLRAAGAEGVQATLGPVTDDGQLWIRRVDGGARSFTDQVHRLRAMKAHYAGVHDRLRRSLGKARRYHALRQALTRAGSYGAWASGPLHELSRQIVAWCQSQGIGALLWAVAEDGALPWDRLAALVRYKCTDAGIVYSQIVAPLLPDETLRNGDEPPSSQGRKKSAHRVAVAVGAPRGRGVRGDVALQAEGCHVVSQSVPREGVG